MNSFPHVGIHIPDHTRSYKLELPNINNDKFIYRLKSDYVPKVKPMKSYYVPERDNKFLVPNLGETKKLNHILNILKIHYWIGCRSK